MRDHSKTDILISGAGVAGLTAAVAFGQAGFSVTLVDPTPPVTDRDAEGADLRTTAFLQPARDFLDRIGLWQRYAAHATPLQVMRIVDAGGATGEARLTKEFDASDISDRPFGWNLPNWLLRRELLQRLSDLPNVTFLQGVAVTGLLTRTQEARVTLSNGKRVKAKLVVAADGKGSTLRALLQIGAKINRYGQKALTFAVTHAIPHNNVSTEIHRTGGPFTLVPLPDHEGRPCSAVVWMDDGAASQARLTLPKDAFEDEIAERSCHLFGPLTLASRRTIWPITSLLADRFYGERTALIAEAAHAVPPIGAQGLNMSLSDIATLLDLAKQNPANIGTPAMLKRYEAARRRDIQLRVTGIDLLNRASQLEMPLLRDARAAALGLLHDIAPVRRGLMHLGLGADRT